MRRKATLDEVDVCHHGQESKRDQKIINFILKFMSLHSLYYIECQDVMRVHGHGVCSYIMP